MITNVATSEIQSAALSFSVPSTDNYLLRPNPWAHPLFIIVFRLYDQRLDEAFISFILGFAFVIKTTINSRFTWNGNCMALASTCLHFLHLTGILGAEKKKRLL